ncbi:MAG: hypothetical protein JNL84_05960 [Candidatus Accumulibacter sp.]|nr:hypothetical protein [Accumulibacter sp.]
MRSKKTPGRLVDLLSSNDERSIGLPTEELFFVKQLVTRYPPAACCHYLDAKHGSAERRSGIAPPARAAQLLSLTRIAIPLPATVIAGPASGH